jgi:phosphoribosyl 1,2-cyclic phosphate phosphodiesterase
MQLGLRLTILGCGSSPGVPRIGNDWGACDPSEPKNRRTRCALLIERFGAAADPTTVLVDTGPDVRNQLLAANVKHIDGVVYTHPHADHIHGIDDLRAVWQNAKKLVDVYADAITKERLDQAFGYCFESAPGSFYPPILQHHPIAVGTVVTINGAGGPIEILPFRQVHGDIDSLGLRIGGAAYSCDISDVPAESEAALSGLDVWIVDALRYRSHPSHFSFDGASRGIDKLKPKRAILTHMHTDLDYNQLKRDLPVHIEPAYDGMQIWPKPAG